MRVSASVGASTSASVSVSVSASATVSGEKFPLLSGSGECASQPLPKGNFSDSLSLNEPNFYYPVTHSRSHSHSHFLSPCGPAEIEQVGGARDRSSPV
jgi:hypothetical protein